MAITATQVKELRDRTGIAMMKCKKALEEAGGDMDAAIENLRTQGLATAAKKADRATGAGSIGMAIDGGKGALVLLSCETDFVSGNEVFQDFVGKLAQAALDSGADSIDALNGASIDGTPVPEALAGAIAKLGENMQLSAIEVVSGDLVTGYNHRGAKAALVAGSGDATALRNVAMHIASADPAPVALNRDGVPADLVEKERAFIADSDEVQAKPEQIRPKIVEGKLGKFYKERVLLEQEMLLDNEDGLSVEKYAKAKASGVTGYTRLDA